MELVLEILSGRRQGFSISLGDASFDPVKKMPWVLEDESIQFSLKVSSEVRDVKLELYQYSIPSTRVKDVEDGRIFYWDPDRVGNRGKLFWNYFGIADLVVCLFDADGKFKDSSLFGPIQVFSKTSTADKVERMFEYLANISVDTLHSVFSATRHSSGFSDGLISPEQMLGRVESASLNLKNTLVHILRNPLTRLVPEHKLVPSNSIEELDDSSIGWLIENLSMLHPANSSEESHLYYEGVYFKASSLLLPVLEEKADIYENKVIHGYVEQLIRATQMLTARFSSYAKDYNEADGRPSGYVSFFDKISKFKGRLFGSQLVKLDKIRNTLAGYKLILEKELPVNSIIHERPIMTPKAQGSFPYRELFIEIIKWYEKGGVDWAAYENLFAIESVSKLFESYSYFRVLESVNNFFGVSNVNALGTERSKCFEKNFIDKAGSALEVMKEPDFWTVEHNNRSANGIVNSEGYTKSRTEPKRFLVRGQRGGNSRRSPDIVIQITKPDKRVSLLVLDAKYSDPNTSFSIYLPELTMKYVHGLHRIGQLEPLVSSLSIIYPDDDIGLMSFQRSPFDVFGETPAQPSLQSCGIRLDYPEAPDKLNKLISRLLELEGFSSGARNF